METQDGGQQAFAVHGAAGGLGSVLMADDYSDLPVLAFVPRVNFSELAVEEQFSRIGVLLQIKARLGNLLRR